MGNKAVMSWKTFLTGTGTLAKFCHEVCIEPMDRRYFRGNDREQELQLLGSPGGVQPAISFDGERMQLETVVEPRTIMRRWGSRPR